MLGTHRFSKKNRMTTERGQMEKQQDGHNTQTWQRSAQGKASACACLVLQISLGSLIESEVHDFYLICEWMVPRL